MPGQEQGAMPSTSWSIRECIRFYERYGRMPFPLQGGESNPPNPAPNPNPNPNPAPDPAKPPEETFPDGLGDAGKEAIRKEREARQTAEKAAKEHAKELEALRKEKTDAEAAKAKAEADEATKQGDFKKLYEAEQKKREDAERERDSEKMSALRTRVAAKHKLPDALADRLAGTTEEELEADAKELAKLVTAKAPVDTEAGAGNKGAGKGPSNRPIPPEKKEGEQSKPAYTFDGQPKVAWPSSG
jgi:hypothetical protein